MASTATQNPRAGLCTKYSRLTGSKTVTEIAEKVYPSGLTMAEAEDLHKQLLEGTRIFGGIALFAHLLAYVWSPWLH